MQVKINTKTTYQYMMMGILIALSVVITQRLMAHAQQQHQLRK
jgi:hypothetical protein